MTTYTVSKPDGDLIERGLSAQDAARAILEYDGAEFKLDNFGADITYLMVRRGGHGPWSYAYRGRYMIASPAADEAVAWDDIAGTVCHTLWNGYPTAMKDEDYDAILAEAR